MPVKTNAKICVANLKGIEASLSILALNTEQQEFAKDLHETMLLIGEIIKEVEKEVKL